jgi:hypothetical protein
MPFPGFILLVRLALIAYPELWLLVGPAAGGVVSCIGLSCWQAIPRRSVVAHRQAVRRAGLEARGYTIRDW